MSKSPAAEFKNVSAGCIVDIPVVAEDDAAILFI
jgi:hypothetical protein